MSRPPRQRLENSSDPFASRSDSVRNPVDSELSETIENYGRYFENDRELLETRAIWPVCPECGHRRTLRCPDCGATGDLFPPGDEETWNAVPSDDPACHGGTSCHGGSGCCHAKPSPPELAPDATPLINKESEFYPGVRDWRKPFWNFPDDQESASSEEGEPTPSSSEGGSDSGPENVTWGYSRPEGEEAPHPVAGGYSFSVSNPTYYRKPADILDLTPGKNGEEAMKKGTKPGPPLVTCFLCGEAFVPHYLPHCDHCGYSFDEPETGEGDSTPKKEERPFLLEKNDLSSSRIRWTLIILALLALLAVLYFTFLL